MVRYKDPSTGEWKELILKAGDPLPLGAIVDYPDGQTVPDGWEEVEEIKPDIYSTEETKIGTWIDGKPLYRKTITKNLNFNNPDSTTSLGKTIIEVSTGISNIDNIFFDESSSAIRLSNNHIVSINNYNSDVDYIKSNINRTNGIVRIEYGSNFKAVTGILYLTLKYTKITD